MAALAIEINDAGLVALADVDGKPGKPSPGYALCEGPDLVLGREAWRRARLRPRHVVDTFWSALDTRPLPRPFPDQLSAADLVHAHLTELWEGWRSGVSAVLLAVPGHYSAEQLALLLGVARAAGLPVDGLVDAAVAAAFGQTGERMLYVDVELHRAVVTELLVRGELVRGRVEGAEGSGLAALRESWARRIADAFVRQTRFDPLHAAESEQELYLKLPAWFEDLRRAPRGPIPLELRGGRVAELSGSELGAASEAVFSAVGRLAGSLKPAGEAVALLLSSRAASLPGLPERLSGIGGVSVVLLPEAAAARGALRAREQIRSDGEALPLVSRLRRDVAEQGDDHLSPPPPEPSREAPGEAPSHVLHGATAHAITEAPLSIGTAVPEGERGLSMGGETAGISRVHCRVYRSGVRVLVEDRSRYGTLLNGARIAGSATARTGDRITIGSPGVELLLISVAGSDGAPPPHD